MVSVVLRTFFLSLITPFLLLIYLATSPALSRVLTSSKHKLICLLKQSELLEFTTPKPLHLLTTILPRKIDPRDPSSTNNIIFLCSSSPPHSLSSTSFPTPQFASLLFSRTSSAFPITTFLLSDLRHSFALTRSFILPAPAL